MVSCPWRLQVCVISRPVVKRPPVFSATPLAARRGLRTRQLFGLFETSSSVACRHSCVWRFRLCPPPLPSPLFPPLPPHSFYLPSPLLPRSPSFPPSLRLSALPAPPRLVPSRLRLVLVRPSRFPFFSSPPALVPLPVSARSSLPSSPCSQLTAPWKARHPVRGGHVSPDFLLGDVEVEVRWSATPSTFRGCRNSVILPARPAAVMARDAMSSTDEQKDDTTRAVERQWC